MAIAAAALPEVTQEPREAAREAGLRYVSDTAPGIRRLRSGRGFRYVAPDGAAVRDGETLLRIRHLAIPPAWTRVWICPSPRGHIQATGRDARGRKQYRYHEDFRAVRDATKYGRMLAFGRALPRLRRRVALDLKLPGLPRDKVLATIVRLLDTTYLRVGNEEYARENRSYGVTTLRNRHASVRGDTVRFQFRGKSGKDVSVAVEDRRVARVVARCQELPGQELFQYLDECGERHAIDSADVNAYLHEVTGEEFTAKDFRTWAGTVLAAWALQQLGTFTSEREAKRLYLEAVQRVARDLNNTPAVCRRCYIHPAIQEGHLDGTLLDRLGEHLDRPAASRGLRSREAAVLLFLGERIERSVRRSRRRPASLDRQLERSLDAARRTRR